MTPVGRAAPLQLSYLQERLWNAERAQGGTATYNMPFGLRIRGELVVDALRGCLDDLIRRHDSFRTTFLPGVDAPLQQVLDGDAVRVLRTDLRDVPKDQQEDTLQHLVAEEGRRVFDLTAAPPLRLEILELGAGDHALLINMHHIISDGWSLRIMVHELAELYERCVRGLEASLPPLPIQYPDYAVWQRTWLRGAALDGALEYWHEHLRGGPLLELPTDRPRPATGCLHVNKILFAIPPAVTAGLQALARREQATIFMVMVAAWMATLSRFASQDDVVVGTSIANRGRRELCGVIGLFTNNLALRMRFGGRSRFVDALRRTKTTVLAAYERQDIPFQLVVDGLAPSRPPGRRPYFDVTIVENRAATWPGLTGCQTDAFGTPQTIAKYDLALEFAVADDQIRGTLTYVTELFDAPTVERLVHSLVALLERVADDDHASVHDVTAA